MGMELELRTGKADETIELGRFIGRTAASGDYICLYGDLGAGKTTFVQGLADGLDIDEPYITSPTFSLVNEYAGRMTLYHVDLYRLTGPDDLEDIGFSELPGDGVAAIEWPERAGDELPAERLDAVFATSGEQDRIITLRAHGSRYEQILEDVCRSPQWSRRSA